MIERRARRPLIVALTGGVAVALVLIATAWNTRRGDYRDCLRTAAAIRPGQTRETVLAALGRFQVSRNEARHVIAICDPVLRDVYLPYYPVMAIEIDVGLDDRGRVTDVATNDVLMWRKRDP